MAENLYGKLGNSPIDNLINDITIKPNTKSVKIKKTSDPLKRGTVLGIATENGYAQAVDSSKKDGTQTADCILASDVDASGGDVFAVAYTTGVFNRKALIFGNKDTADKHESRLRELGILLKDNVGGTK